MAYLFEDFQKFGKEQFEAVTASSSSFMKNWQTIASESNEYTKKSFENGSSFIEKLMGAKSFETAVQLQSDFARTSSESFLDFLRKTGEYYSNIAKEAFKPIDAAIAKTQASKN